MPNAREFAVSALQQTLQKGKRPKDVFEGLELPLDDRDRAFMMEIVYGVLRHSITIDWVLSSLLRKPSTLGNRTINNLRAAAYQILYMRVPEWAAVNEAVEMEKEKGRPAVVNGVLRNMLRDIDQIRARLAALSNGGGPKYISLVTSHPQWLISRYIERFGEKEAVELAEANNRVPPLTLRVNTLKTKRPYVINRLSDAGIQGVPTTYSPDGIKLCGFRIYKELSSFMGEVTAQDEASQLVTYLLDPQPGERILDASAAPGGKTTHIAQLMLDNGEITAVDRDEARLKRLRDNVSTLGLSSIIIVHADIADFTPGCRFDRILLDAPCSALGVIRRNPDVKYKHTEKDLAVFKSRQLSMLRRVSVMLKPGGMLVYSVCSTEPEEGEDVIKEFLKDSEDFYIIETSPLLVREFMRHGFLRTYPHRDDMDGFFGARLGRKN